MSEIQQKNERLSAFIDAEQSDIETAQIIDDLLNDPAYRDIYIRMQLVNDSLHGQIDAAIVTSSLSKNISETLDTLPAHYVENAVHLQPVKSAYVKPSSWFDKVLGNRMVSGVSVAASVMFVTLLTLQSFDTNTNDLSSGTNTIAENTANAPSLIQATAELPANLVATSSVSADNERLKQQYRWIEADPKLSRQVREYINQHDTHRAAYSLQPKIRSANYQITE